MKFSGNMWLMIILKVTKNHGFHSFSEKALFEKPQGERLPNLFMVMHVSFLNQYEN